MIEQGDLSFKSRCFAVHVRWRMSCPIHGIVSGRMTKSWTGTQVLIFWGSLKTLQNNDLGKLVCFPSINSRRDLWFSSSFANKEPRRLLYVLLNCVAFYEWVFDVSFLEEFFLLDSIFGAVCSIEKYILDISINMTCHLGKKQHVECRTVLGFPMWHRK